MIRHEYKTNNGTGVRRDAYVGGDGAAVGDHARACTTDRKTGAEEVANAFTASLWDH